MSDQRKDQQLVDPADFVGEPPAGDAFLDDFVSNDQSAAQSSAESSTRPTGRTTRARTSHEQREA